VLGVILRRARRPIAKGRLGRPIEFGYKAQVLNNVDGVVLDHSVDEGNPPDAPQLAPAVARVITGVGRRPRTVTADRGYGEARVEDDPHDLGVRIVVIPRKGRPSTARQAAEHRAAFRKIVKCEPAVRAGSTASNADTAGTAPASTPSKEPDLDRTGGSRPQTRQDRHPGRLTGPRPATASEPPDHQDRLPHRPGTSSGRSS
jgi:IS5 family transposase